MVGMGIRWILVLIGSLWVAMGYCAEELWLIEQEFVKWGKKEAYEGYKKEQQKDFFKKIGYFRFCVEVEESSQFIYLIPVKDFKGLNTLMQKRMNYHQMLTEGDEKEILPFLSTIHFFVESLHYHMPECSFIPVREPFLDYPAVYYYLYDVVPGNGPLLEQQLKKIAADQKASPNPVPFKTWRVLFGGDVPSYVVAVFGQTPKEAKNAAEELQFIPGQMKSLLRQEKKASGVIRKELSSFKK
jgi:hypothetical protein